SSGSTTRCSREVGNSSPLHLMLRAVFWEAIPKSTGGTWKGRNIFLLNGTPSCLSTARLLQLIRGAMALLSQSMSAFISGVQITSDAFPTAKLARKTSPASRSADNQWLVQQLNGLFQSSKRRAARSFTTPVASILTPGPST